MSIQNIRNINIWTKAIYWLAIPLICIYLISMIIAPWIMSGGDWQYIQNVWDRWQSLNVGMLAFISTVGAFAVSMHGESQQRERRFKSARAFLPEALSELIAYFKASSLFLVEAWGKTDGSVLPRSKVTLEATMPMLPVGYKETFSRCIESAEPAVAEYLTYMLMCLQVHNSRLQELSSSFQEGARVVIVQGNIITYLFRLSELQALTNKLFQFARGLENFDGEDINWEDFNNAYLNLDIHVEDFDDLEGFTKRAIERGSSYKAK